MKGFIPLCAALLPRSRPALSLLSRSLQSTNRRRHGSLIGPMACSLAALSTAAPSASLQPFHPAIDALTAKLDVLAPRFELEAGDVDVLITPEQFYATLRHKILAAKHRVFLSSLYIGKEESELVDTIATALTNNPALHVSILIDALRGTREAPLDCAASLLLSLVQNFPDRVDVRMYHTPNFRGLKKRLVPQRFNEGWGLQHIKLYGADDEVILSGANLSRDYFTNRQDRYHVFKSREITAYYALLHEKLRSISYRLEDAPERPERFRLEWPASNGCPEPYISPQEYCTHATNLLSPLLRPTQTPTPSTRATTLVYPLSQLAPLSSSEPDTLSTEARGVTHVLDLLSQPSFTCGKWIFTAGYFNPSASVQQGLINARATTGTVITASPEANGFFGSPKPSGYLPDGYAILARRFLQNVQKAGSRIALEEWRHVPRSTPLDGWTYHAKGIWIMPPSGAFPVVTLIGSSNFTRRSDRLDLEATCVVITRDEGLQRALGEEVDHIREFTRRAGIGELDAYLAEGGWRRGLAVRAWVALVSGML